MINAALRWVTATLMLVAGSAVALPAHTAQDRGQDQGQDQKKSEAAGADAATPQAGQLARLTQFFGVAVDAREGDRLGSLEDLLIGPDGRIAALIVTARGPDDKTWQVPWSTARPDDDWTRIVVDAPKDGAKEYPVYRGRVAGTLGTVDSALASLLLQAEVRDGLGNRLGEVVDVRIDLSGRVYSVLFAPEADLADEIEQAVESEGFLTAAPEENLYVVPWSHAQVKEDLPAIVAGTTSEEPEAVVIIGSPPNSPPSAPASSRQRQ